ncbi:MAG TPA: hypothetical protein VK281_20855 [Xanthobacteraceae bacterium]|nr:hypothetical protein [Xanthobacteraceae bacterium]
MPILGEIYVDHRGGADEVSGTAEFSFSIEQDLRRLDLIVRCDSPSPANMTNWMDISARTASGASSKKVDKASNSP